MNKPQIPKFPPNRIIEEGLFSSLKLCFCGSTLKRNGCLQPNCENYYKGFPNDDINYDAAVYKENGIVDYSGAPNE